MDVRGRKIFVGLSGGVDSAVSAALLKQTGAQVTGVFIKGWYPPGLPCAWGQERRDAMRVAACLGIHFRTLEAGEEYKKSVIDYLLSEYQAGRTPNPDVMCNRDIKFGVFYRYAITAGADAIATGHYRSGPKDQTYFLWAVPKEILEQTIFPVGNLDKAEVRKLAKRFKLPVSEKADSTGICFLGPVSVEDFLRHELGEDNPAIRYTIGQRVGGKYVTAKNVETGEITLSETREGDTRQVRFSNLNSHGDPSGILEAQMRYRGLKYVGRLTSNMDAFIADEPLSELPAPGQSIVFFKDAKLIGGGIIEQ